MQANIKTLQNGISTAALKKIIHKLCVATWSCGLLAIYTMNQRCCGFLSVWQLNLPCSTFLNGLWADPGFVWITLSNPNSCHTILQLHIGQKMTQNWLEGPSHPQQNSNTRKLQKGNGGGGACFSSLSSKLGRYRSNALNVCIAKGREEKACFSPLPQECFQDPHHNFLSFCLQLKPTRWGGKNRGSIITLSHTHLKFTSPFIASSSSGCVG